MEAVYEFLLVDAAVTILIEGNHEHFDVSWGKFVVWKEIFDGCSELVDSYDLVSVCVSLLEGLEWTQLLSEKGVIELSDEGIAGVLVRSNDRGGRDRSSCGLLGLGGRSWVVFRVWNLLSDCFVELCVESCGEN